MSELQDIIYACGVMETKGFLNVQIGSIAFDSRKIMPGAAFVAVAGTHVDGHQFIEKAILSGAKAIVCGYFPENIHPDITYIRVQKPSFALGMMSSNFFNNPSKRLHLVGITGTNGKTTIATLLYHLFTLLGFKSGLMSTIANKIGDRELSSTHTTPDAVKINELLNEMVDAGCEYVFMEVSSHAIDQDRIAGLNFAGGVFTNLTHDHLDYHLTFKAYLEAKKQFFDQLPSSSFALSNADDKNGKIMLQNTKAKKMFYGIKTPADFKGRAMENHMDGMLLKIDGNEVYSLLSGDFNCYNLLAIYGTALLLNQSKEEVLIELSKLKSAEGRFEVLKSANNITIIIDYAHTPDALENVLNTINAMRTRNEQLITVTGAGGDRDKTKRPIMAGIASRLSTKVILTSDNPRTEDPNQILNEMLAGIDASKKQKTMVIVNRKEAIKTAWNLAQPGDLILVAGKGHEKYQEINGIRHHFDDKEIIEELMKGN
ncbi:MAG: UDP-N-acetylmuramoyl-L-alanyl-D-glutamate--2,6-diaminopimelate ligase [Bacteroidetes bacterium CG18_big_fil_WC_8_21_14_2_50_41_14]|nr:MAG: UDP-N-acetylmuramoyl-L-alanyl-D-glutamate--2,6-diaminopimelate ligase [Bacteroidetes bacterium CG18_big_fil_WC_8_21_14_2_50_41_14]PJB60040.1 MAG: UDP-N-acetylmuramoyl-L-alanyl-D-glutamate--2,6-diaminopimelate ligase [Bacteroidetes bacterium CG_4_9_14_3_um_filter_41_19]